MAISPFKSENHPPLVSARKRKFENPTTPANSYSNASAQQEESEIQEKYPPVELFLPQIDGQHEDMLALNDRADPWLLRGSTSDGKAFLRIAQCLADQFILHSYSHPYIDQSHTTSGLAERAQSIEDPFSPLLELTFPGAVPCKLKDIYSFGQQPAPQDTSRVDNTQNVAKRSSAARQLRGVIDETQKIFRIEAPLACIQRGGASVDVAVSALKFWEELSFAPASAAKDIDALCIFPSSTFLQERAASFMSIIGSTYQNLKLGMHEPYAQIPGKETGLVSIKMSPGKSSIGMYEPGEVYADIGRS